MNEDRVRFLFLFCLGSLAATAGAQRTVNTSQAVVLEGLRANQGSGSFTAAAYGPSGDLYLLYDQHDGLRVLKTNSTGSTLEAQAYTGATGDDGVAMSIDPAGNVYVTGTTTSGMLLGTSGAAYPRASDASTNSFVAKFDANLNLVWLSFLGAGRTAAVGVAPTASSVFVTGITFDIAFPVTPGGVSQVPALGSTENGFVESFSADGTAVSYATYLTGSGGNTVPTGIVADSAGQAYITGSTSASGYPTSQALQPVMLLAGGSSAAGFLTKLNATGSSFVFSTFLNGAAITGIAFDARNGTLLLSGDVHLGEFPVPTVAMPLANTTYQTMLRLSSDGQTVMQGVLIAAGTQSLVNAGSQGDAWVTGTTSLPLFPGATPPDYFQGDSFLVHVTSSGSIDQTLRLGGAPKNNARYAAMTSVLAAPAVAADGTTVALAGTLSVAVSASLLGSQTFDLPTVQAPNTLLPNAVGDLLPSSASCGAASVCDGSGGLLAIVETRVSQPSLSVSNNDFPNISVRNVGSGEADGLVLATVGYVAGTNCGNTLLPSGQCSLALTGTGPGSLVVSASNATAENVTLPSSQATPDGLALSAGEVDFGIASAAAGPSEQTITVTNISGTAQNFTSAQDGGAASTAYSISEISSDCATGSGEHTVAAGGVCHVTLGLIASSNSANDGAVRSLWKIGTRDLIVTGFAQAAALAASSTEVDFGTNLAGTPALPRYLYLSNSGSGALAHSNVALPSSSAFSVADNCPSVLEPRSFCQMAISYSPQNATELDADTLTLDDGVSVSLTGEALPTAGLNGAASNPVLQLSASALTFATAVSVTGLSNSTLPLTVTNTGAVAVPLSTGIAGDFTLNGVCPATLAAGASCTLAVGFAPSQPGSRLGLVSFISGSNYAPAYVSLSGSGTGILPANNGELNVGQALLGEPAVAWYKLQQSLPALSIASSSSAFTLALVEDTGTGHGTLPQSSFSQSVTGSCGNCWLGVQFVGSAAGAQSSILTLRTVAGGNAYTLTATGTAFPVSGIVVSPMTVDFGPVTVGSQSAPFTFSVADLLSPASDVVVQSVSTTGDFTVLNNATGGSSCSGTLLATASCYVQISFAPASTGERGGALTVVTSDGTAVAALAGYGLPSNGLAISPDSLVFSAVPGPTAKVQTLTLSNDATATLNIGSITASDPSLTVASACGALAPGAQCSATVTFAPSSSTVTATLAIPTTETLNGQGISNIYGVPISGSYTTQDEGLQILAAEANYGAEATGGFGGTRTYTLNNLTDKQLNVTLQMPRQFPLASSAPCTTLAAGASCAFSVSYAPVTNGESTGTVFAQGVSADGLTTAQSLTYLVGYGSGTGTLAITGNPIPNAPLSFGQLTSGQKIQQTLTVTNTGASPVTVYRLSSEPPFLAASTCGVQLNAGDSCTVTLTYAPVYEIQTGTTGGTRSDAGTLTVESDAAPSPQFVALSGYATPVTSSNPASSAVLAAYTLSESSLTFSSTQIGNTSALQTVTLTNTGTTTLHVASVNAPMDWSASTTCGTVLSGASCDIDVAFAPTMASNAALRTGTLEIASDATDALEYITLAGPTSAAPLTILPGSLSFGSIAVGTTTTLTISVTNTSAAPVTFTGLSATGGFNVVAGTCPQVGSMLAAGTGCALQVSANPAGSGILTGTLTISTDATSLPLTVSLTATATAPQLQVVPTSLAFGSVTTGSTATLTATLTNIGSATLTGLGTTITGSNAAEFTVVSPCNVTTLAPGQGCYETMQFAPSAAGAQSAVLTFTSSDPNGPAVIPMSGTGLAATTASFTLSVNGASSATVTVVSGTAAQYPLTLTPVHGYAGTVALTCSAITPGKYASCSLPMALLTLNGAAQSTTATIATVSGARIEGGGAQALWLLSPLLLLCKRMHRRRMPLLLLLWTVCSAITACGKGAANSSSASNVVLTPAGTYQYQVTASATSGPAQSSTVTLNLTVQ